MTELVITPLARDDLDEVLVIEEAQFDDPWSSRILRDELASDTRRYTKATIDGVLAGYLGLMVLDTEAHVNTIATAPAMLGRGVATTLLVEGIRGVVELGARDVTLEVASRNERAQQLYVRFGFAPVGIRRGYYRKSGDDAVVMWVRDVHEATYEQRLCAIEGAAARR